jgi:hypothetical protein
MSTLKVEWEWAGPTTYVRPAVTRGSAAGANWSEVHILLGMNRSGDVAFCGLSFPGNTVRSRTPTVGNPRITLPVCDKCRQAHG